MSETLLNVYIRYIFVALVLQTVDKSEDEILELGGNVSIGYPYKVLDTHEVLL